MDHGINREYFTKYIMTAIEVANDRELSNIWHFAKGLLGDKLVKAWGAKIEEDE